MEVCCRLGGDVRPSPFQGEAGWGGLAGFSGTGWQAGQCAAYIIQHTAKILHYILIGIALYRTTAGFQKGCSDRIMLRRAGLVVTVAIYFHHQSLARAVEIDDEFTNAMLTPELNPQLTGS